MDAGRVNVLDAAPINDARSRKMTSHPPIALAGWLLYVSQLVTTLFATFL